MAISTEKLIREVKRRKVLWDTSSEVYNDREGRRRGWEEITNIMWDGALPDNEKMEFGKSLQTKWKNIRTCYTRELKRRAGAKTGSAALRKTPYVYFELLQFLGGCTSANNPTENMTVETHYAESNDEDDSSSFQEERHIPRKKAKKIDEENLIQVLKDRLAAREERERNSDFDLERLFLLSLVEEFKKIPRQRHLTTKLEIMKVIKMAQMISSDSEHSTRHGPPEPDNRCPDDDRTHCGTSNYETHLGLQDKPRSEMTSTDSNIAETSHRKDALGRENKEDEPNTETEIKEEIIENEELILNDEGEIKHQEDEEKYIPVSKKRCNSQLSRIEYTDDQFQKRCDTQTNFSETSFPTKQHQPDEYEVFASHMVTQLRQLPLPSFIKLQEKFQSLITQERLHSLGVSSKSTRSVGYSPRISGVSSEEEDAMEN